MNTRRKSIKIIIIFVFILAAVLIRTANVQEVYAAEKSAASEHGYYYGFLNKSEKKTYDAIVRACEDRTGKVELKPVKEHKFWNAYAAVRFDHPEYYWLHNYDILTYRNQEGRIVSATINIPYNAGVNSVVMEAIAENTARQISSGYTEYEKYKYIYDTVAWQTTYGKAKGVDDQSITGVLIDQKAVCSGYADAFKYLCDEAGLFCIRVEGYTKESDGSICSETHAWNMIRVDGIYYWVDVTWGDTRAENDTRLYGRTTDYYNFLCATDDTFLKDHIPSDDLLGACKGHFKAEYPACTNDQYTNFRLMGRQFSCTEDTYGYIRDVISGYIPYLEMQFPSTEELHRAINILHDNGVMWDLVCGTGVYYDHYTYYYNDVFNTLVFEFA